VLTVACIITLNRILPTQRSQKCISLLFPTDFFRGGGGGFLPLSLVHNHLVKIYNYEFNNYVYLSITSSLLEFNLLITLLLNSVNIYFFLNTNNLVSNTDKQHVTLYITNLNHYGFLQKTKGKKINYTTAEAYTVQPR